METLKGERNVMQYFDHNNFNLILTRSQFLISPLPPFPILFLVLSVKSTDPFVLRYE
jgi:hypothetical protein